MSKRRRSLLQIKLLLILADQPVRTITELAERVNITRPSVSRSLKILREDKLIRKFNGKWQVTKEGKKEVNDAKQMLADTTKNVSAFAEQFINSSAKDVSNMLSATKFQLSILNSPVIRIIDQFAKSQISSGFVNIATDMAKTIQRMQPPFEAFRLNLAIEPLLKTQELSAQLMRDVLTANQLAGLSDIIKNSNIQVASAITNTITIQQLELIEKIQSSINFDGLFSHLTNLNKSYENLFSRQINLLKSDLFPQANFDVVTNIALPTSTVAFYNASVRNLFDAETENFSEPIIINYENNSGDETLDSYLEKLDPDFVEMRRGSWIALESKGPDYLRQSATSQRELLSQILELLAPNALLPNENKQGPQIKARTKIALGIGDLDSEFIDACSKAVLAFYKELNKYTHSNEKHEEGLRAILQTGEGLIRFILAKVNSDKNN